MKNYYIYNNLLIVICLVFYTTNHYAQKIEVIDNKGTLKTIINNSVFEAIVAPTDDNSEVGDIWLNTNTGVYHVYDGTGWDRLNKEETTFETIDIGTGNQTITGVDDADKIVGFTLISNTNSLGADGRMSSTYMIGDNRETINCLLTVFEGRFMKYLSVSVQINNAANEIVISRYTSRFWDVESGQTQASLRDHQTHYRLGKIVIIRKE